MGSSIPCLNALGLDEFKEGHACVCLRDALETLVVRETNVEHFSKKRSGLVGLGGLGQNCARNNVDDCRNMDIYMGSMNLFVFPNTL